MAGRNRQARLHPILVVVPIGCWAASFVFDVTSRFVAEPGFLSAGSYWLISIGLIGAVVAGAAGFIDVLPVPSGSKAHRIAMVHFGLTMSAVLLFAVSYVVRAGSSFDQPVSLTLVSLASVGMAVLGAAVVTGHALAHRPDGTESNARQSPR